MFCVQESSNRLAENKLLCVCRAVYHYQPEAVNPIPVLHVASTGHKFDKFVILLFLEPSRACMLSRLE